MLGDVIQMVAAFGLLPGLVAFFVLLDVLPESLGRGHQWLASAFFALAVAALVGGAFFGVLFGAMAGADSLTETLFHLLGGVLTVAVPVVVFVLAGLVVYRHGVRRGNGP